VHSLCSFQNCKSCCSNVVDAAKKRKHKNKLTGDGGELLTGTGFAHPKRPLRRGSFRSSSFGGVGNRKGSGVVDPLKVDAAVKESIS
jgi:hypothetical protein